MRFKEITLRGTAYERGFTYGQLCKDEIRLTMKGYEKLFFDTTGVTWEAGNVQRRWNRFHLRFLIV